MIELTVFLLLLATGFFVGRVSERAHYKSILHRERELQYLSAATSSVQHLGSSKLHLVSGACSLSDDFFKMLCGRFRQLIGGEIYGYTSVVDRARREAILRMKEQACRLGASSVVGVRIETSTIGSPSTASHRSGPISVEVYAYGTAVIQISH